MKNTLRIASLLLVLAMCVVAFASCGMGTYEKRLEKAEYKVEVADEKDIEDANKAFGDDYEVKAGLSAVKDGDSVSIIQFANKDQAEKYADTIKAGYEAFGGKVEVKGKTVISGSEAAVKVALGE